MRRSGYIQRVQNSVNRQLTDSRPIHTQMCLDAAMIAANEVFQMGPGRAEAFASAFSQALTDIAEMAVSDTKDLEYSKAKLDERLKGICGEKFVPWDIRYRAGR